jgi:hypothetical protein
MVRMAAIYGHYTLDDLREAIESPSAYPAKTPVQEAEIDPEADETTLTN